MRLSRKAENMRDCDERERWAGCEGWDKDKKKK
jgi:hypothetical protein